MISHGEAAAVMPASCDTAAGRGAGGGGPRGQGDAEERIDEGDCRALDLGPEGKARGRGS